MTEREKFLERWSRKKAETTRQEAAASPTRSDATSGAPATPAITPNPEFDLSKLPPLDSITSVTDIRAFLAPGVPPHLSRAALRRAWTADPAIRDFIGLAENAWDFTDPSAMPGFGDIPLGADIKKMVAEVFGQLQKSAEPRDQSARQLPQPPKSELPLITKKYEPPEQSAALLSSDTRGPEGGTLSAPVPSPPAMSKEILQCENNVALQQNHDPEDSAAPKTRRAHGRALPK
jgi:hypothetical protein